MISRLPYGVEEKPKSKKSKSHQRSSWVCSCPALGIAYVPACFYIGIHDWNVTLPQLFVPESNLLKEVTWKPWWKGILWLSKWSIKCSKINFHFPSITYIWSFILCISNIVTNFSLMLTVIFSLLYLFVLFFIPRNKMIAEGAFNPLDNEVHILPICKTPDPLFSYLVVRAVVVDPHCELSAQRMVLPPTPYYSYTITPFRLK